MKKKFSIPTQKYSVNKEARELNDVIILQKGEADGHGMLITDETLDAFMALNASKSKVRIAHDGIFSSDQPLRVVGYVAEFYRTDENVKAKVLKLLPAFTPQEEADYAKLMAMAETMPETFGLSIVFKFEQKPAAEGQLPVVIPTKLYAVDIVSDPAATPGLFSTKDEDEEQTGFFSKLKSWLDKKEELDQAKVELASAKDTATKELNALKEAHKAELEKVTAEATTKLSAREAELVKEKEELASKLTSTEAELNTLREAAKLNEKKGYAGELPPQKDVMAFQENPFLPESYNETKQARLRKERPELAKQLEAEALAVSRKRA